MPAWATTVEMVSNNSTQSCCHRIGRVDSTDAHCSKRKITTLMTARAAMISLHDAATSMLLMPPGFHLTCDPMDDVFPIAGLFEGFSRDGFRHCSPSVIGGLVDTPRVICTMAREN